MRAKRKEEKRKAVERKAIKTKAEKVKERNTGWAEGLLGAACLVCAVLFLAVGIMQVNISYEKGEGLVFAADNEELNVRGQEVVDGNVTESRAESETETESETESGTDTESGMGAERETESGTGAESGTKNETETESGTKNETETGSGTKNETETESEAETEPETESGTEPQSNAEAEIGTDTESEPESETEIESESDTESETRTESGSETEGETKTESEMESGTEKESGTCTESEAETESGIKTENGMETESETEKKMETEQLTEQPTEQSTEPITEKPPLIPEKIKRGKHYEILGDQGAWYRDSNAHLWLRRGTNLYIESKNESGFDSLGTGKENVQNDGILTFQLQKADANGQIQAISEVKQEPFYVDGETSSAAIHVNGNRENGIIYAAQAAEATIQIPPDGKSGLKKAEYCIVNCRLDGTITREPTEAMWLTCEDGQQVQVQAEGIFQIYVRTQDQVGNQSFARSEIFCVDQTPPELTVEGVGDQTANSEAVQIQIFCRDHYYRQGSMKAQIVGVNRGKSPSLQENEESAEGAALRYFDFPHTKSYDDIYEMQVTASDLAGNQSEKKLKFSVNRFGSVYDLSDDTQKGLKQYYLSKAQNIVFYETNIDYVGESEIFCRRDGELIRLKRGMDYQVTMQGSGDSWKQYQYTVPADYFRSEGIYEMLLSSTDLADNQSDTGMQEKRVVFVLDRSSPTCIITGIQPGQIYDQEQITVCLVPDDNFNIAKMRVYADSSLLMERKAKTQETIKLTFEPSDQWRTLQVYLCDQSGNEYWSEEIPFFVRSSGQEVEPYQKKRESAEEIELRKRLEDMNVLERFNFTLEKKDIQQTALTKTAVTELPAETELQVPKRITGRQKRSSSGGRVLFLMGLCVFLATSAGLLWVGNQRKK